MKYLISLTLISLLSCQNENQKLIYSIVENNGNGECYFSAKHENETYYTEYKERRIIEIIEPTFKTELISYNPSKLSSLKIDDQNYQIPIKESYTTIILKDKKNANYLRKYEDGFVFCKLKIPTENKNYTFEELKDLNFIILMEKIETQATLFEKIIKDKPKKLLSSQIYLREGYYNIISETIGGGEAHGAFFMLKVRDALSKQGYDDLDSDDWQLEETRKALFDFQKKNNLNTGVLDEATAHALGLQK